MTAELKSLLDRANALFRTGPREQAIAAYQTLLATYPDQPDSWYNLAVILRQSGRHTDALSAYEKALAYNVSRPEDVHLNRAVIYLEGLRDGDRAEAELQRALALAPEYTPALLNLASLAEDRGDRDMARTTYDRLLEIAPNDADALSRRAGLEQGDHATPMIQRLVAALEAPGRSRQDKATLGFELGRLYDSCGEYDAAFAAYREANANNQTLPYDPAVDERLVAETIEAFPKAEPLISGSQSPVFILGMFRSGSTLIEQILSSHPEITSGGELDLIPRFAGLLGNAPKAIAEASNQRIMQAREAYTQHMRNIAGGARMTDKRPDNVWRIGLIKHLFPDAKIIYTRRQPLDNCLSVYFLHLNPAMTYANDLSDIGYHLRAERAVMAHWNRLYPEDILTVNYEDTIADQRMQTTRILNFLGLEWDDACLAFHTASSLVRTASVWQVREPIHARSVARWKNYETYLDPLKRTLNLR